MTVSRAPTAFASEQMARDYIASCEQAFEKQVVDVCQGLIDHPELRLIGLSGPTCAGKTTAASLLIRQLESAGRRVHMISVDDFFREQPHGTGRHAMNDPEAAEKLDFDSIDALDFPLFCAFMDELMTKGRAPMPKFNIGAGVREGFVDLIAPNPEDVFLLEGIQVVYPEISSILHQYSYRSIFIQPTRSLDVNGVTYTPNDIRLLRRLVRDYYFRSSEASFTFFLWDSVRKNEENNIFPYVNTCDEQLDSLMGYEIGMLRPHLDHILSQIPLSSVYRDQGDAILRHISGVQPLSSAWLPQHALYREFVPIA